MEFILLAWLYAFYCFDYKWALLKQPLAARIAFFESQWAFLGGFGAVCTLTTVAAPFYVGAAVMAVLFPLFILLACDTSPRDHMQRGGSPSSSPGLPKYCTSCESKGVSCLGLAISAPFGSPETACAKHIGDSNSSKDNEIFDEEAAAGGAGS